MTLSGPASQPFPVNPFPPTHHVGPPPDFSSHFLQPSLNNVQNIPPNSCTTDDWSNRTPGSSRKGLILKRSFCPDASEPNLSGWYPAYVPFKKFVRTP